MTINLDGFKTFLKSEGKTPQTATLYASHVRRLLDACNFSPDDPATVSNVTIGAIQEALRLHSNPNPYKYAWFAFHGYLRSLPNGVMSLRAESTPGPGAFGQRDMQQEAPCSLPLDIAVALVRVLKDLKKKVPGFQGLRSIYGKTWTSLTSPSLGRHLAFDKVDLEPEMLTYWYELATWAKLHGTVWPDLEQPIVPEEKGGTTPLSMEDLARALEMGSARIRSLGDMADIRGWCPPPGPDGTQDPLADCAPAWVRQEQDHEGRGEEVPNDYTLDPEDPEDGTVVPPRRVTTSPVPEGPVAIVPTGWAPLPSDTMPQAIQVPSLPSHEERATRLPHDLVR